MCNQMQTITIVRGTTLPLTVQIEDADGNAYTLILPLTILCMSAPWTTMSGNPAFTDGSWSDVR